MLVLEERRRNTTFLVLRYQLSESLGLPFETAKVMPFYSDEQKNLERAYRTFRGFLRGV